MYIEAGDKSSGGMIKSFSKNEFNEALSYLEGHEREGFLNEVSQKCPDDVDYLNEFIKELREFSNINLNRNLYKDKKTQRRLEYETCEMLEEYINGSGNMSEILANLESVSTTDTLVKILWKVDDIYRDRFLNLLIKRGTEGIDGGISNRIINEGCVEMWDYLEKVSDLGASIEELVEWGIEWGVEDALIIANRKDDIYPFVKMLTINEREKALNFVKNSPEMIGFISEMTRDTSARVSKLAIGIREQII